MKKLFVRSICTAVSAAILTACLSVLPAFARLEDDDKIVPSVDEVVLPAEFESGKDGEYTPDYSSVTCVVVSPNGDDNGKGTYASPFKTLEKARDVARGSSAEGVVVALKSGDYYRSSPFVLDERDSGDSYVCCDEDGFANITGCKEYSLSSASKVTDERIISNLADSSVASRLYSVNLWNACPDMKPSDIPSNRAPAEFYINGVACSMSQYPSEGFLTVSEKTGDYSFKVNDKDGRLSSFKDLGTDIMGDTPYWIGGYPGNDWSYYTAGATINFDNGCEIEDKTKQSHYGINVGQRIFFYNIISEITDCGQYAIDKDRNLYFLLDEGETPEQSTLSFSSYKGNLFEISGDDINISNIVFRGVYEGSAISASSDRLTVNSCGFTGIQNGTAVKINGMNNIVANSTFFSLGSDGVSLTGGNTDDMIPSGNTVFNCDFEEWATVNRTYSPAISLYGVGGRLCFNSLGCAPHLAVYLDGCNHTVEYNDFFEVCRETADAGVIYSGRSYFNRGNIIRYNYFTDIIRAENTTSGYCSAIYQDDCGSSFNVYGNVFVNCDRAFLIGGGRDNIFEKNLLINCGDGEQTAYSGDLDARGIIWGNNPAGFDPETDKKYLEGEYIKQFPEAGNLWEDGEKYFYPVNNVVRDNILLNSAEFKIDSRAIEYGTVENNIITEDTGIVEDYGNCVYNAVPEKINQLVDRFPILNMDEIGTLFGQVNPTDEETFSRAAIKVSERISSLPDTDSITDSDKQTVADIRSEYNRLLAGQKALVTNLGKLCEAEKAVKEYNNLYKEINITDCKQLDGWSVSEGFSAGIWNISPPQGNGYFVCVGAGGCNSTFTFAPMDLTGLTRVKLLVYVVDPDDLKSISFNSPEGSVRVKDLDKFEYTVGGWVEINPEIDFTSADQGFDIKNVSSVTFTSDVAPGDLTLIGYDCIRVTLKNEQKPDHEKPISGDIDGDKTVSADDALKALCHSVHKIELTEEQIAIGDMNGDGNVTAVDAMLILKTSLNFSPKTV